MEAWLTAPWLQPAAQALQALNPAMDALPRELSTTSANVGGWYLSPQQHALELITLGGPLLLLLAATSCMAHPRDTTWRPASRTARKDGWWEVADRVLAAVVAASYALLVVGKALTGRLVYLAAPCNAMSALLVYFFIDTASPLAEALFNGYLCTMWGVLLALGTPDTRDQVYSFEYPHFFVTHALELAVPLYLLARRQYAVQPAVASTLWYFAVYVLIHLLGYGALSVVTESNLNYVMQPPKPLRRFGRNYRPIAVAGCLITTLVVRHVVVAGILAAFKALCPQRQQQEKEKPE